MNTSKYATETRGSPFDDLQPPHEEAHSSVQMRTMSRRLPGAKRTRSARCVQASKNLNVDKTLLPCTGLQIRARWPPRWIPAERLLAKTPEISRAPKPKFLTVQPTRASRSVHNHYRHHWKFHWGSKSQHPLLSLILRTTGLPHNALRSFTSFPSALTNTQTGSSLYTRDPIANAAV